MDLFILFTHILSQQKLGNSDPLPVSQMFETVLQKLTLVLGRSIVSGIGTLTYISVYLDQFLQPLLSTIPIYIQDTTHFRNKLNHISTTGKGVTLVIMVVFAQCTNIPHDKGILACDKLMVAYGITCDTEISELIRFILKNNNFVFNDRYYLETKGTAKLTR